MTKINNNTPKRTFKHLTDILRGRLEEMSKLGFTQIKIAQELGVSQSTISRELKRGRTKQMKSKGKYFEMYLADAGSRIYHENRKLCRSRDYHKYSEKFFHHFFEALKSSKEKPRVHSVDSFVNRYRQQHPFERVPCTKTVYSLIDCGVLPIKNIDLPMKLRLRPRKKHNVFPIGNNIKHLGTSIEKRDISVLSREEFGHWEVDLVLGKKTKGEPVIITLIERKTRKLFTKKVWSKDAATIQKAIKMMIIKAGTQNFKTITTDNGSEFSTLSFLENMSEELSIYFTHAFASWEKGTNERHNGLLREFVPKGSTLKELKYKELQSYTNALNNRPRKIMDYKTPLEMYEKYAS